MESMNASAKRTERKVESGIDEMTGDANVATVAVVICAMVYCVTKVFTTVDEGKLPFEMCSFRVVTYRNRANHKD